MIAGLKRIALALATIAVIAVIGYFGWNWYERARRVRGSAPSARPGLHRDDGNITACEDFAVDGWSSPRH